MKPQEYATSCGFMSLYASNPSFHTSHQHSDGGKAMAVSEQLWVAIKTARRPAYKIAQEAGVRPDWLSKAINKIETINPGDPRIIAVGRLVGIPPAQCFEETEHEEERHG